MFSRKEKETVDLFLKSTNKENNKWENNTSIFDFVRSAEKIFTVHCARSVEKILRFYPEVPAALTGGGGIHLGT